MAWRVLGMRMEEMASRFGVQPRVSSVSNRGHTTNGGPPAWGLVEVNSSTP